MTECTCTDQYSPGSVCLFIQSLYYVNVTCTATHLSSFLYTSYTSLNRWLVVCLDVNFCFNIYVYIHSFIPVQSFIFGHYA